MCIRSREEQLSCISKPSLHFQTMKRPAAQSQPSGSTKDSGPTAKKPRNPTKPAQPKAVTTSPPKPNSITIVFGTYEHILYGLNLSFPPSPAAPTFTTLFQFVAHRSPLNVLAVPSYPATPILASSASDTPLTLWSISKRRCIGTLSCGVLATDAGGAGREPGVKVARFDRSGKILVVGDETGGMTVYRTSDWALVRKFSGGGKGRVNDLAIEPQKGRIMLSVGQDRCLRMWDLSGGKDKGKPMASVRLGTEAERLGWSPSGKKMVVVTGTIVTVYDTMMSPLFTFTSPRGRVHDAKFFIDKRSQEYLILACDDSVGRIFHLGHSSVDSDTEPKCVAELIGHSNRVKSVELVNLANEEDATYAVTISSDGFCHVYNLLSEQWNDPESPHEIEPIAKHDTGGCRLTCLSAVAVAKGHDSQEELNAEESDDADVVDEEEEDDDDGEDEWSGIDLQANGEEISFENSDDCNSDDSEAN
ncbi:hypothetical protein MJO29_001738 [Puccinia striiformis f. sp. tritici]|uniref:Uncharacterized protein n=3 Tax=Puccinia striiformis TaxID=27350 RepID=A0A0L0W5H8_9BASI|nr:hypothetical protein MJO29_001738 [Puccinia striiformis f. sp. tritici]KNF06490.1 hypothetical protein PSTG_00366 [Puccinia striiformis f. sp. tritici PST-78]